MTYEKIKPIPMGTTFTQIEKARTLMANCNYCIHYGTEDDYDMCKLTRILHDDDWFCADGERRRRLP